jgi:aerobic carbon-monoxide dehydrogenase medium subunit
MKPAPFEYHVPTSRDEALALLAEGGFDAKILAGGQSLVPAMNFRLARPAILIDVNRIADLAGIHTADDGSMHIGALTRQRELERSPLIAERAPLIAEAMPYVAHPQIRNRGTIGGSLAHADPAAELPALAIALKARLRLQSRSGERWLPAADFFLGVLTTALEPDEMLTEIAIPPLPARSGSAFDEVARRHGDYAIAGAAAVVTLADDGTIAESALVLMAVGDAPIALRSIQSLRGQAPTPATIQAAAESLDAEIDPPSDLHATTAYRRHLVKRLAGRTLTRAVERAAQC